MEYCCEGFKKLSTGVYITVDRKGNTIGWYCEDSYTMKALDKEYYPEYDIDDFISCPYCRTIISKNKYGV